MTEEYLREIVAKLGRIDPRLLNSTTQLTGPLGSSLGRARLDAALRAQSGVSSPAIYTVATYGELCKVLGIGSLSSAETTIDSQPMIAHLTIPCSERYIRIGVDMESLEALPTTLDYWEDEFYKRTFTLQETAYALLQSSPKASFAAMWCAKEALRKAHSELAQVDWKMIEVIHAADGKPSFVIDGDPIGGALSMSHNDDIAFAAYVSLKLPQAQAHSDTPSLQSIVTSRAPGDRRPVVIAVFALLFSILAILLAFLHR
jgi:phosphopantetheine--protein transferase-like protein